MISPSCPKQVPTVDRIAQCLYLNFVVSGRLFGERRSLSRQHQMPLYNAISDHSQALSISSFLLLLFLQFLFLPVLSNIIAGRAQGQEGDFGHENRSRAIRPTAIKRFRGEDFTARRGIAGRCHLFWM